MKLISRYCHSFWISRSYGSDCSSIIRWTKVHKNSYSVKTWKWAHCWIMFRTQWYFCHPSSLCKYAISPSEHVMCSKWFQKITWMLGRISINGIISWNKSESFNLIDFAVHREIIRKWENYLLHAILASLLSLKFYVVNCNNSGCPNFIRTLRNLLARYPLKFDLL